MAGGGDASALTPVKDTSDTARGNDRFLKSVSKVPPRVRRCCRLRAWCCGGLVVKEPGEATLMSVLSTTARQLYPLPAWRDVRRGWVHLRSTHPRGL